MTTTSTTTTVTTSSIMSTTTLITSTTSTTETATTTTTTSTTTTTTTKMTSEYDILSTTYSIWVDTASTAITTSTTTTSTTTPTEITYTKLLNDMALVPYSAVGPYYCSNGRNNYYFATTFYTRFKHKAFEVCESYECDLIVEWSRPYKFGSRSKNVTGWDVGRLSSKMLKCPHNKDMTAKVIWYKHD